MLQENKTKLLNFQQQTQNAQKYVEENFIF